MNFKYSQFFFILIGGLFLLWPAIYNGYPLVYSDSHVFISQPVAGFMNWDKPFVYGPLILIFHGWQTLWLVVIAQALLVSHLLWLVAISISPGCRRHLVICACLALLSTAPWFVSFLMPDIFAAIVVLCIFLLAFSAQLKRFDIAWLIVLGAFAIAVHLSHLVIAAACLLGVFCLDWHRLKIAALPCIGAFVILLGTNLYAFDKVSISPHGSVFMLARMAGDGNVREVLEKNCIQKKWYLCEWENRLPIDSDDFLWNDKGPVWSHPGGPIGLAPEASEIVSDVFRTRPWAVLLAGLKNMTQQLWLIQLGDTLHPDHLDVTVAKSVRQYFSAAELARLNDSRQMRDTLAADAVWFSRASSFIFCLSVAFGICFLVHAWLRFDRAQAPETVRMHKKIAIRFILIIWVGVLANAFATGALSKPHHRYQARIAWLLVLPPLLLWRYTNICKKQGQSSLNHSR